MARFLLPLSDYNRIHQVAHGVIRGVGTAERACMFFAAFGAHVLNAHYKIPSTVVAGAFGLCVAGGEEPKVAFFGRREDDSVSSDDQGFHMWVQTHSHLIDFMAPIFPEAFAEHAGLATMPRKMLQRPLAEEAIGIDGLTRPGDFIGLPNTALTAELIERLGRRPANSDLLQVADTWFERRTGKQRPSITMGDSHGPPLRLSLPATMATGSW